MNSKTGLVKLGRHRGFTQVELAVSVVIVGVLMVASLNSIAGSRRSHYAESARAMGGVLANNLMAEISKLPLREPTCDCGFGPEAGEVGSDRRLFDDIDDYDNLVDSPPKRRLGTELDGFAGWSRSVTVQYVPTNDWSATSASFSGVYRIVISIKRGTATICNLVAYRTSAYTFSPSMNSL